MNPMACLVSKQAMANVIPVLMYKPEKVWLLVTKEEKKAAGFLVNLFNQKNIKTELLPEVDAYDGSTVTTALSQLFNAGNREFIINVTGGTKLMSFAAYQFGLKNNLGLIYCNTDRDEIIHLSAVAKSEKIDCDLSVCDYLLSYGFACGSSTPQKAEYNQLFDFIESKNLWDEFIDFTAEVRKAVSRKDDTVVSRRRNFVVTKDKDGSFFIKINDSPPFYINETKESKLFGKWLEFYTAKVIKERFGIAGLTGVKIFSPSNIDNEIDFLCVHNYRLYMFSCKSGATEKDAIYEVETLKSIAGGTFGKAHIVSSDPGAFRNFDHFNKRAKDLNVAVIKSVHELKNYSFS